MNTTIKLLLSAAALVASVTAPAFAGGGVFDKFDPCIEQTDQFQAERASYLKKLDQQVADADHAMPTQQYRDAWMKAKRSQLRDPFDTYVAPTLKEAGVQDMEVAYSNWFSKRLEEFGANNVDNLVIANFRQELKQVRIEERSSGEAQVQSAKEDLDKACKMDVGNQALRGIVTTALAPIEMIAKNLELAKNESGAIAKGVAATTGISVDAIEKNGGVFGGGLSGGENSFFRKNLGVRF